MVIDKMERLTANDPYLGREALYAFDNAIIACMEVNSRVAPATHKIAKSNLQTAACQIIPSGISLALSVRELVREAYLYGALVLERPLAERAITILYLHKFPEKVDIWNRGWSYRERPSLAQMFDEIGGDQFPGCGPELTRSMNSLTHGDPASTLWNLVTTEQGAMGHAVARIMDKPDLCDKVCLGAAAWVCVLMSMATTIFPDAATKPAR